MDLRSRGQSATNYMHVQDSRQSGKNEVVNKHVTQTTTSEQKPASVLLLVLSES